MVNRVGQVGARAVGARGERLARGTRGVAFTLIELLVVIAVIAILVGITMPALGNARETARRVKCAANLRGIGTAMQMYMDERKGHLPATDPLFDPAYDPETQFPLDRVPGIDQDEPHVVHVLAPYMQIPLPQAETTGSPLLFTGVSDALKCPSDRKSEDEHTQFQPVWRGLGWSYSYFAGELILATEFITVPKDVRAQAVTKTYEQIRWKDLPVIYDYDDWHPLRKGQGQPPRNCVYFGDWRADWATDMTKYQNEQLRVDQLWRDLVCDIGRFGGIRLPGCD